jgi:hypothetical protein
MPTPLRATCRVMGHRYKQESLHWPVTVDGSLVPAQGKPSKVSKWRPKLCRQDNPNCTCTHEDDDDGDAQYTANPTCPVLGHRRVMGHRYKQESLHWPVTVDLSLVPARGKLSKVSKWSTKLCRQDNPNCTCTHEVDDDGDAQYTANPTCPVLGHRSIIVTLDRSTGKSLLDSVNLSTNFLSTFAGKTTHTARARMKRRSITKFLDSSTKATVRQQLTKGRRLIANSP